MRKSKRGAAKRPLPNNPRFKAWFDGCCEPVNPGGTASYGAVIFEGRNRIWECSRIFYPQKGRERETSNNVAEYGGFISILEWLEQNGHTGETVLIHGDSKLVIEQCFGTWRVKAGHYVPLANRAKQMLKQFPNVHGKWIPRDQNEIADELSKAELVKAGVEFRIQPNERHDELTEEFKSVIGQSL